MHSFISSCSLSVRVKSVSGRGRGRRGMGGWGRGGRSGKSVILVLLNHGHPVFSFHHIINPRQGSRVTYLGKGTAATGPALTEPTSALEVFSALAVIQWGLSTDFAWTAGEPTLFFFDFQLPRDLFCARRAADGSNTLWLVLQRTRHSVLYLPRTKGQRTMVSPG